MDEYSDRDVDFIKLESIQNIHLLDIERMVIQFDIYSVDFGSLCYTKRDSKRRQDRKGKRVVQSSFVPARIEQIRSLIKLAHEYLKNSHKRPLTIESQFLVFIKFIDWCDANQHTEALNDVDAAMAAIKAYITALRTWVSQNNVSINAAGERQSYAINTLKDYFGDQNLDRGLNLLRYDRDARVPTQAPDDESTAKLLAISTTIFEGFHDLTINGKPFPFLLKLPSYLEWQDDVAVILPTTHWLHRYDKNMPSRYQSGDFGENNTDLNSMQRIQRGILAIKAYHLLFIAATGMNAAQVAELPWSYDLEEKARRPTPESQSFRAIKYRAHGKQVTFTISARHKPYLVKFIELRKYVLQQRACEFLFFDFDKNHDLTGAPIKIDERYQERYFRILKRMFGTIPKITSKKLRAAKQDYVIRNADPVLAADIMQHSFETAISKYSNGSESLSHSELGEYFHLVEKTVLEKNERIEGAIDRSVGICTEINKPKAIIDSPPAEPDCRRQEGCLFCEKYRVHADEIDIRKLLSLHYCLRETAHFANSAEEHEAVFGHILRRIDELLTYIQIRSAEMASTVKRVRNEVDIQGTLDPFWSAKLEFLMMVSEI